MMGHVPSFSHHVYVDDSITIRYSYKEGTQFGSDQVVAAEWRSDHLATKSLGSGITLNDDTDGNAVFVIELGQIDVEPGMVVGQLLVDIGNGLIVVSEDYLSVSERL